MASTIELKILVDDEEYDNIVSKIRLFCEKNTKILTYAIRGE